MSTAAITEFNTILAEAHIEAVKALTALLRTATDRTEIRRLATVLVRVKRLLTESDTPRNPRRRAPLPAIAKPLPAREAVADIEPRPAPLISATQSLRTPRAFMLAAATGLALLADPLTSPGRNKRLHQPAVFMIL